MEYWSDAFKTQYSNTPVLQHSFLPNLDPLRSLVVDLPVDQVVLIRKNTKVPKIREKLDRKECREHKKTFSENSANFEFFAVNK
jgi:hypothetical protein